MISAGSRAIDVWPATANWLADGDEPVSTVEGTGDLPQRYAG